MSISTNLTSQGPLRLVVDPNSFARRDPKLSVSTFDAAQGRIPAVDDTVLAVQPDDDGFEGVALGTVRYVNHEQELIYTEVDWSTFEVVPRAPTYATQGAVAACIAFSGSDYAPGLIGVFISGDDEPLIVSDDDGRTTVKNRARPMVLA